MPKITVDKDHGDEGYGAIVGQGARPVSTLVQQRCPETLKRNALVHDQANASRGRTFIERSGRTAMGSNDGNGSRFYDFVESLPRRLSGRG